MAAIFKMAAISGMDISYSAMKSPRLLPYRSDLNLELYILTRQKLACGFR